MNYLFHLYLSADDHELLLGNFMGDFVKGRLGDEHPPRVRQGIVLHRRIDSFAARDEDFRRSRQRLPPSYGLYRGVLVDLFYDHFLAAEWQRWSPFPLPEYLAATRRIVEERGALLPPRLRPLVPLIFDELIPAYLTIDGIGGALERMSRRIGRPNPLAGGAAALAACYPELRADFRRFTPRIRRFAAEQAAAASHDPPGL